MHAWPRREHVTATRFTTSATSRRDRFYADSDGSLSAVRPVQNVAARAMVGALAARVLLISRPSKHMHQSTRAQPWRTHRLANMDPKLWPSARAPTNPAGRRNEGKEGPKRRLGRQTIDITGSGMAPHRPSEGRQGWSMPRRADCRRVDAGRYVMRWGPRTAPSMPISAATFEVDSRRSAAELVELGRAECE
jgi:hypothetical protein